MVGQGFCTSERLKSKTEVFKNYEFGEIGITSTRRKADRRGLVLSTDK